MLVEAGHDHDRVLDYPLDEALLYLKSIRRLHATRRADYVVDTSVAIAGVFSEKNTFVRDHLSSLAGSDNG